MRRERRDRCAARSEKREEHEHEHKEEGHNPQHATHQHEEGISNIEHRITNNEGEISAWTQLNATFNLTNWLIVNSFLNLNLTFGFVLPLT